MNDAELAMVFNALDAAGSGCVEAPLPDTFDCAAFGASDLTLIEDATDIGGLDVDGDGDLAEHLTVTVPGATEPWGR